MNLQQKYSREDFIGFLKEFLPEFTKDTKNILFEGLKVTENAFSLGECEKLDLQIIEITHKSTNDARVALASDGFRIMKNSATYRSLVVYHSESSDNWRLSLMTVTPEANEKGKATQTISNPRRYSFYLGPDAKTNTPETYLIKKGKIKDIDDLKKRFSIEVVNKDFYTRISELFTQLAGGTRGIGKKSIDAGEGSLKLPSTSNDYMRKEFAAQLIGRLVFCWFLKKKKSIKDIPLLSEHLLSSNAIQANRDYYHSLLEPLFFEVLNAPIEERKMKYKGNSWDTIPFLNGGLFSPHTHDYYELGTLGISKYINTLKVPDKWLKELFEMFEMYNFTIDENSSVDVELSVDPEMLGRIFENLLAEINPETGETARKSTGSFYTPRPIVEYMVDESLKQYLLARTKLTEDTITKLLAYNDTEIGLTEAQEKLVVDALDSIKIIDPACGSGAFPMGILQKILHILQKVDPSSQLWFDKKLSTIGDAALRKDLKSKLRADNFNYIHKLGIIREAIYGVDIQPIAVEISKLRFFLSLIVDESVDDSRENRGIEPLPNLEFKFVCANSLFGLPKTVETHKSKGLVGNLFEATDDISQLKYLRDEYLRSWGDEKQKIEQKFQDTRGRMFRHSMSMGGRNSQTLKLSQWNPFAEEACSWFDPEWMFGVRDGFDIVIANPPYVRQEKYTQIKEDLKNHYGEFFSGRSDLYTYFIKLGFDLIKRGGVFAYITSNKYFVRGYGKNTRALLSQDITLKKLVNFGELPVFQASVDSAILIAENTKPNEGDSLDYAQAKADSDIENIYHFFEENKVTVKLNTLGKGVWSLQDSTKLAVLGKIKEQNNTLGSYYKDNIFAGIKTGYDAAFVIDAAARRQLIKKDPKCAKLIKPWLRGKDVQKWEASYKNLYIIYIPLNKVIIDDYPTIKEHLMKYQSKLRKRATNQQWYEMQQPQERFTELFDRPKLIYPDCAKEMRAMYDESGAYGTMAMYFMQYDPVIIGILNSKLFDWYARMTFATFGDPWKGGRIIFKTIYMSKVPIPDVKNILGELIKQHVDRILAITKSKDYLKDPGKHKEVKEYENKIDQLVYKLYDLTDKEISIVEKSVKK